MFKLEYFKVIPKRKDKKISVLFISIIILCCFLLVLPAAAYSEGLIAFTSTRDGNPEIYVMNADGSGQTRLTYHAYCDLKPAWSPNGRKIAFYSRLGEYGENSEIYVMNADGSGQTRLTTSPGNDWDPAWSPDGKMITFSSDRDGDHEIYVMNADGSKVTRLTNNTIIDATPAWSPDGTKIAFCSGDYEIYVMNADGSKVTQLTKNTDFDAGPAWSPDGTKIAYYTIRGGNDMIYVMNADGTGQKYLTSYITAYDHRDLAWSPDGMKIAYHSLKDGDFEIFQVNLDGTGITQVTNNNPPYDDVYPSWGSSLKVSSPNGGEIWKQGTTHTITWTYTGLPGTTVRVVQIKGTTTNVIKAGIPIGKNGLGSFTWHIPYNQTRGQDFRIRIVTDHGSTDTSDANFTIAPGAPITIMAPNGGETWQSGTTQNITWKYNGDGGTAVKIKLFNSTLARIITTNTSIGNGGKGSFAWEIPSRLAAGNDYRVRIVSLVDPTKKDVSNNVFAISM